MNHTEPEPLPPRFKLVNGAPQHFGDTPTVILRDYETQLEYPFLVKSSALRAQTMILEGTGVSLYSAPFHLNAFQRIMSTLEAIS